MQLVKHICYLQYSIKDIFVRLILFTKQNSRSDNGQKKKKRWILLLDNYKCFYIKRQKKSIEHHI